MEKVSSYIAQAAGEPLPEPVAEKAKHHILDTIAAIVSGSELRPGRLAIDYVASQGGTGEATVLGSPIVTTAVNAAFANGMLAHADETDDSHAPSLTHPGCAVVPAALAMAEKGGRSGREFLRAVVCGYDIGTRTTMALGPEEMNKALISSHTVGGQFGAAAAAGSLAGLSERQARYLLSYMVQQASGVTCWARDEQHVEKAFVFGGMPAHNGVLAATMVSAGFTGLEDAWSGDRNFFEAFSGGADPERLTRGLGQDFEILNTNIKKWSVGSPIQAAVDALLELREAAALDPDDVEEIRVRVSESGARTVDRRRMPDINMQHIMALVLLDGHLTFKATQDYDRMDDPRVIDVRRKVTLEGDEELTRALPSRQAIVTVRTREGEELTSYIRSVRGTADNPMTRQEVEKKAVDLLEPVLGGRQTDRVVESVWQLERIDRIGEICGFLRPGGDS